MKKQLVIASMLCAAACFAQNADSAAPAASDPAGALLKSISFDTTAGFQQWPDDSQIEVALRSLTEVMTGNREDDKW